jgi:hypothetical protein
MKVRKELTVALENRPGALGRLCASLAGRKVNILAISVHESAEVGIVRLVVDKTAAAEQIIGMGRPLTINSASVLELTAPNKPGILADIARRLGANKVNIDYVYGSALGGGKASIILKTSEPKKAAKLLKGF